MVENQADVGSMGSILISGSLVFISLLFYNHCFYKSVLGAPLNKQTNKQTKIWQDTATVQRSNRQPGTQLVSDSSLSVKLARVFL